MPRRSGRVGRALGASIVLVMVLAWFAPIFQGKSFSDVGGVQNGIYPWRAFPNAQRFFPQSDQADLTYPWQSEITSALHSGTLPLWNPNSFGGQPLFANGSIGMLFPARLLLAITTNPTTAHNLLSMLYVAMAGLFMYLFLCDLDASPMAATFGAVTWMFGSFTLDWVQLEVVAPIFAFLPLGMAMTRRAFVGSARWIVAAALAIALLLTSAHLLLAGVATAAIIAYGTCLALSRTVRDWRQRPGRTPLGSLWRLVGLGALSFGLASVVLVPTVMVLRYVGRQRLSFRELSSAFLLHPSDLRYTFRAPPLPVTDVSMHQAAFVGTITAALAIVGLISWRRGSGLGRGLVVIVPLVAIGGPLTWLAFNFVPGMNVFRPYSRLLFLFDFGVSLLGAIGLDIVVKAIRGRSHRNVEESDDRAERTRSLNRSASVRRVRVRRTVATLVAVVIVAVTAFQLGSYGRKTNPIEPSSRSLQYPRTQLIQAILDNQRPGRWPNRVLPVRDGGADVPILYANESLVFGFDSASGYDSSVPTRTVDLWQVIAGDPPRSAAGAKLASAYLPAFISNRARFDLLPRVGVNEVVLTPAAAQSVREPPGWKVMYSGIDGTVLAWQGPPTGPVVVQRAEVIADDASALERFASSTFDYRAAVILVGHDSTPGGLTAPSGSSSVLSATRSYNGLTVSIESSGPGWLVVPDMWDPGWKATVNGRSVSVKRANYNQQAVAVPTGTSIVRLRYWPAGLTLGATLSFASVVACLVLLGWPGRRQRYLPAHGRSGSVT